MSTVVAHSMASTKRLPERYLEPTKTEFKRRVLEELRPGLQILDVGAGRQPVLPLSERPADCMYVGLDLSASEFAKAEAGSYTDQVVGDLTVFRPELSDRFDLILSWQVLEHVKPLSVALGNIRAYLKPGGRFIGQLSGTFSAFGVINMVIPNSVGPWILRKLLHRDPETVFPAHYDRCWFSALEAEMKPWCSHEIQPRFRGAGYWGFSSALQRGYLLYENWAMRNNRRNLATHYIIDARR